MNIVNSLNDVLDDSVKMSGRSKTAKMNNEKTSINQVKEARMKSPIKSQEQRIPREASKISRSGTKLKVRMSQSPSIRALNEKLLPAKYAADRIN